MICDHDGYLQMARVSEDVREGQHLLKITIRQRKQAKIERMVAHMGYIWRDGGSRHPSESVFMWNRSDLHLARSYIPAEASATASWKFTIICLVSTLMIRTQSRDHRNEWGWSIFSWYAVQQEIKKS